MFWQRCCFLGTHEFQSILPHHVLIGKHGLAESLVTDCHAKRNPARCKVYTYCNAYQPVTALVPSTACQSAAMALQGMSATAQGQSFIGHSDSITGLAWAGPNTLISTGAGDAVLIWRLTPAAVEQACRPHGQPHASPDSQPLLQATPLQASAPSPALDGSQGFNSFHGGQQGSMRQSLEAATGLLQSQVLATHPAAATLAAVPDLQVDPAVDTSPTAQSAQPAHAGASQHQLLAKLGIDKLQQQDTVHSIPAEAGLHLERVVGYNGAQHGCCLLQEQGLLVYATDQFLVLEQLASREQRWDAVEGAA